MRLTHESYLRSHFFCLDFPTAYVESQKFVLLL